MSTSLTQTSVNDFITYIQSIASGKPLTTQQQQKLNSFVTNVNNVTDINRRMLTHITKHFLETGSFTMSGNITYTGTQTFTGSVDLSQYATVGQLDLLSTSVTNQFFQVNGAVNKTFNSDVINYDISGTDIGAVKALISVPFSNSNYTLNIVGSSAILDGTVCKFTIINQSSLTALPSYASQYSLDSSSPLNFTASSIQGTGANGGIALQEIIVVKLDTVLSCYSNIIYMSS